MTITRLAPLPAAYTETTGALHRLAVYVIAPAQRLANGEIILRATPGGFSTFPYDGHVVGVDGDHLVVDGARSPITTLNAAAAVVGITPDVAQQEQFDVPPHGDLDEPLGVDPAAAHAAPIAAGPTGPHRVTATTPGRTSTCRRGRAGSTASSTTPRSTAPACCVSGWWMIPTRRGRRSASCARRVTGSAGGSE